LTWKATKLSSKLFAIDAMPTLLNQDAKSEKASIRRVRSERPRVAGAADGRRGLSVSKMLSRISAMIEEMEDMRDELALEEARQTNRGKPTTTINELRRKRGLPGL